MIFRGKPGARELLSFTVSAERTTHMKPSTTYLAAPTLALFGSLLFGGCYTEFTLADRYPADEPVYVDQPPVVVIVDFPEPTYTDPPPFYPPVPTGAMTAPRNPATSPKRETGMKRTPPVVSRPAPAPSRGGGSTSPAPSTVAPAPAPAAPAPAAPVRGGESRPAGGGPGRK